MLPAPPFRNFPNFAGRSTKRHRFPATAKAGHGCLFRHPALIQHINAVCVNHVGQRWEMRITVFFPAKARICSIISFSLSTSMLEVASSKRYTGLSWSRARAQCQPLPLSAGKVGALFQQLGVQPLFRAQKALQVHLLQHLPQPIIRSVRVSQKQIFPDGAGKQVAVVADVGDMLHQTGFGDLRQGSFPYSDRARCNLCCVP